jgi:hypothetical protein
MSENQPALNLDGIKLAFKPNLSINASSFVPSVKPVVEFSPQKEENLETKTPSLANGLAKKLFAPSTFNPNATAFKPTIPMAAPAPEAVNKKRPKTKKKPEGDKSTKN